MQTIIPAGLWKNVCKLFCIQRTSGDIVGRIFLAILMWIQCLKLLLVCATLTSARGMWPAAILEINSRKQIMHDHLPGDMLFPVALDLTCSLRCCTDFCKARIWWKRGLWSTDLSRLSFSSVGTSPRSFSLAWRRSTACKARCVSASHRIFQ